MKIINLKLKFKTLVVIIILVILGLSFFFLSNTLNNSNISMNRNNYTNILKEVHDNTYDYSGDTIIMSGYLYKAPDFKENQFVIARNMMVTDSEYRIVGFLCEYDKISDFENDCWVKAKGIITLGDYHGPMPIIKVIEIHSINPPRNQYVQPPN